MVRSISKKFRNTIKQNQSKKKPHPSGSSKKKKTFKEEIKNIKNINSTLQSEKLLKIRLKKILEQNNENIQEKLQKINARNSKTPKKGVHLQSNERRKGNIDTVKSKKNFHKLCINKKFKLTPQNPKIRNASKKFKDKKGLKRKLEFESSFLTAKKTKNDLEFSDPEDDVTSSDEDDEDSSSCYSEISFDSTHILREPINTKLNMDNNDLSDDSCPELVPISNTEMDLKSRYPKDLNETSRNKTFQMIPHIFNGRQDNILTNIPTKLQFVPAAADDNDSKARISYSSAVRKLCNFETPNQNYKVIETKTQEQIVDKVGKQIPSSSRNTFYNSFNLRYVLLLLKNSICFHGTMKLKLVAGNAEIFGYRLQRNEIVEAFSPKGNSLLEITPIQDGGTATKVHQHFNISSLSNEFLECDLNEIRQIFDKRQHALIVLERNDCGNRIAMIKKYMKENVFLNINSLRSNHKLYSSEFILRTKFYGKYDNCLRHDPEWNKIQVHETSRILIVGGQQVGKSTLCKYLINRNLQMYSEFLLIDLDIGQPECFLPQTVTATLIRKPILGAGFFYNLKPEKSFVYGSTNVVLSPLNYIKNVKALIELCIKEERFTRIPWIVNTMGYNKGFGAELISVIIQLLRPSEIIQLQSFKDLNNFDIILSSDVVQKIPRNIFTDTEEYQINDYKLILLNTIQNLKLKSNSSDMMTAKDYRYLIIMSRLGSCLSGNSKWLTSTKPFRVSIDALKLICFNKDTLDKDAILDIMDANIVYLCKSLSDLVECYGLGIVRGIDRTKGNLYLLSSVQADILINVNALAVCNIPLPTSIVLNQGRKIEGIAPYMFNTFNLVSSKHIQPNLHKSPKIMKE